MAKFILLIFALQTIIFVPFSRASDDEGSTPPASSGNVPCTLCGFGGASRQDATFKFSEDTIALIPERCEVICYGYFRIDNETALSSDDRDNIKSLTAKGYKVWTFVSYRGDLAWDVLLNGCPEIAYEKQMQALTLFINGFKISGIILDMIALWDSEIPDFTCKLNEFICKLKKECSNVLVGVVVSGIDYKDWSLPGNFDLAAANKVVDFYFIDTFTIGVRSCSENTSSIGTLPLTVDDTGGSADIITLDTVSSAVDKTEMDPKKKILNFILETKNEEGSSSYTEYCCKGKAGSKLWCADPVTKCYKEGATAKSQNYAGISITYLDFDDYDGSCGCGYFPVTNAFIDGFQSADEPCCAAIDTPKSASTTPTNDDNIKPGNGS